MHLRSESHWPDLHTVLSQTMAKCEQASMGVHGVKTTASVSLATYIFLYICFALLQTLICFCFLFTALDYQYTVKKSIQNTRVLVVFHLFRHLQFSFKMSSSCKSSVKFTLAFLAVMWFSSFQGSELWRWAKQNNCWRYQRLFNRNNTESDTSDQNVLV